MTSGNEGPTFSNARMKQMNPLCKPFMLWVWSDLCWRIEDGGNKLLRVFKRWEIWARENQYPPVDHEGWMVSGQETVFCWVAVPWLTMVASSVAFFSYLLIHLLVGRQQIQALATYKQSTYLAVTCLPIYRTYFLLGRWNQILTQLRLIHNWAIMGIQFMVHWWVLVHSGQRIAVKFSGHDVSLTVL
jgi:hypothetical protein